MTEPLDPLFPSLKAIRNPVANLGTIFQHRCNTFATSGLAAVRQWCQDYGDPPLLDAQGEEHRLAIRNIASTTAIILTKPSWNTLDVRRLARNWPHAVQDENFCQAISPYRDRIDDAIHRQAATLPVSTGRQP